MPVDTDTFKYPSTHAMNAMEATTHTERHRTTYREIESKLSSVRETFESVDPHTGRSMLLDGLVYAIMSVQNSVEMLERAFRGYAQIPNTDKSNKEALRNTMKGLNYGNNKLDYIRHNIGKMHGEIGETIRLELIEGSVWKAVELLQDHCKGVSWIKASFVPAMLGYTEVMCIDTNVAQMVDTDSVQAKGYTSADSYRTAVETVLDHYDELADDWSPFMVQWILFDANRGESVEHHDEWFEVMLPGSVTSRQAGLSEW